MKLEKPVNKTIVPLTDKFCPIAKEKCKGDMCVFGGPVQCAFMSGIKTIELRLDRIAQLMGQTIGSGS
jgi:hypothetical protein